MTTRHRIGEHEIPVYPADHDHDPGVPGLPSDCPCGCQSPEPDLLPDPGQVEYRAGDDLERPRFVLRLDKPVTQEQLAELMDRIGAGAAISVHEDAGWWPNRAIDWLGRCIAYPMIAGGAFGLGIIGAYGLVDAITRWASA